MRVTIKYCGSCNPYINLASVGNALRLKLAREGHTLVWPSEWNVDVLVVLNGCEAACADLSDVHGNARRVVVVAGGLIGDEWVVEREIPGAVVRNLSTDRGTD